MNFYHGIIAFLILGCSTQSVQSQCSKNYVKYNTSCVNITELTRVNSSDARNYVLDSKDSNMHCGSNMSFHFLNKSLGRVEFALYFRHDALYGPVDSIVTINTIAPVLHNGEEVRRGSYSMHSTFSTVSSDIVPCGDQQLMKLVWVTNYISNERYELVIEDWSCAIDGMSCCRPLKFNVTESEFKEDDYTFPNYPEPYSTVDQQLSIASLFWSRNYINVIIESDQLNNDCHNPMLNTSCVKVKLRRDGFEPAIWHETYYKPSNESLAEECPAYNSTDYVSNTQPVKVSCKWPEGVQYPHKKTYVECRISDAPPGPYRLDLELLDTRCALYTIWTGESGNYCEWTIKIEAKDYFSLFLIGCVTVAILTFIVASAFLLPTRKMAEKLLRYVLWVFPPNPLSNPHRPPGSPVKVLLLYARDCDPVMSSMSHLRKFLVEDIEAQVFDIWDECQAENIAARGGFWAVQYLTDDQVDVILVTTPLTCLFEDALLKGLIAEHNLKDCRDDDFLVAFKAATELNLKFPSRRFVIMRLNKEKREEALTRCLPNRSFLLSKPEGLRRFVSNLLRKKGQNDIDFSSRNVTSLAEAVGAFENYVSSTPEYPDDILVTRPPPSMDGNSVDSFILNFNEHLQNSASSNARYIIDWLRTVSVGTAPSDISYA